MASAKYETIAKSKIRTVASAGVGFRAPDAVWRNKARLGPAYGDCGVGGVYGGGIGIRGSRQTGAVLLIG